MHNEYVNAEMLCEEGEKDFIKSAHAAFWNFENM